MIVRDRIGTRLSVALFAGSAFGTCRSARAAWR
jgi:hypothetical protein